MELVPDCRNTNMNLKCQCESELCPALPVTGLADKSGPDCRAPLGRLSLIQEAKPRGRVVACCLLRGRTITEDQHKELYLELDYTSRCHWFLGAENARRMVSDIPTAIGYNNLNTLSVRAPLV